MQAGVAAGEGDQRTGVEGAHEPSSERAVSAVTLGRVVGCSADGVWVPGESACGALRAGGAGRRRPGPRGPGVLARSDQASPQVLELPAEPGGVPAQLHEVHHQPALPSLPLHRGLRSAGHAALWGAVSEAGPPRGRAQGTVLLGSHSASPTKALRRAAGPDTASRCQPSWAQWTCLCLSKTLVLLRFNFQDETPTTNFDTFPAAILTVFQVRLLALD